MNSAVLVTGCAGFIGSTLIETLLARGEYIIGVDNFSDYYDPKLKQKNIEAFLRHPNFLLHSSSLQELQKNKYDFSSPIQCIVHLAAYPGVHYSFERPDLYVENNINGTIAALEIAKKYNSKFIFASSSSVYGNCSKSSFLESEPTDPVSVYGSTKLFGEQLCRSYSKLYSLNVCCLRIFTCYGPKQRPDLAIRKFATALRSGGLIELRGVGDTSRDYTYVTDIVDGIIKAKHVIQGFDIINLGNNKPISLSCVVQKLCSYMKVDNPQISQVAIPMGDVLHTCADIEKAKNVLGWEPQVGFDEGIQKFIAWL
jgi:UDP-glucuronate 4-epimerase